VATYARRRTKMNSKLKINDTFFWTLMGLSSAALVWIEVWIEQVVFYGRWILWN
jgi:tRNA (Thr-GGU) A37 N-methylase